MKIKSLTTPMATALLAATLIIGAPAAAQAVYTPGDGDAAVTTPTVAPGAPVEFVVDEGVFAPGTPVTIALTGENASGASLAFVKFAVETATLGPVPADADGSLGAEIRLPSNATGSYTITATGLDPNGATVTTAPVSVTVAVAAAGDAGSSDDALAVTGADNAGLLGLWIGGGALLLAGGGLAVAGTVRRHRQQTSAA